MLDYDSTYANQGAFRLIQPPADNYLSPFVDRLQRLDRGSWIIVSLYHCIIGSSVHKRGLKVSYTAAVVRTNVLLFVITFSSVSPAVPLTDVIFSYILLATTNKIC